jgi:dTDP-4-amino-4,6-dideoxygalactose transaminase
MIPVTRPALPPLDEYVELLKSIWSSRVLTNGGPFHQKLEEKLCSYLGVNHVSLFCNGTIALIAALRALKIKGDVITTPYSFVATTHALLWNECRPIFADIDPVTLNISPDRIEQQITSETKAILAVHCYGYPCDVDKIDDIGKRYNIPVIYDAAHAFGVSCHCGSLLMHGDLAVLSFHATKVFNTFEGGAIVSRSSLEKSKVDQLKNFGFVDEVTVEEVGINGKMSELNAALGLLQLNYVDDSIRSRRAVFHQYIARLKGLAGITCVQEKWIDGSNFSYFPVLVGPEYPESRDQLYLRLREHRIMVRRYFYPLISNMPMYINLPSAGANNLRVASQISKEILCLPIYDGLEEGSVHYICDLIKN